MVMTRLPKTIGERQCLIERRTMDMLRECYKKKLINEREAAKGLLDKSGEASC